MGEDFDVTWGGFSNNFQKSFQKFGAEPDFSDVTLSCEGGQVEAHRVVLAAGSPHLHALLKRNPEHRFIYLRGVDLPDLKDVVSFLYKGYITVEQARLSSILALAEDLKVEGLYDRGGGGGSAGGGEKVVKRRRPGGRVQVPEIVVDVYVKEEEEDNDPPFHGWPAEDDRETGLAEEDRQTRLAEEGRETGPAEEDRQTRPAEEGQEGGHRAADGTYRAAGAAKDMQMEEYIKRVKGRFVCQVCRKTMAKKPNMRRHVEAKHFRGNHVYTCDICSDELPTKTGYHNHMRRHK